MEHGTYILGAGVTGLAAGWASGLRIFEAAESPGGICSSYYVRPGDTERLSVPPTDGEAYRFEIGGGHWIFGGDPLVLDMIQKLTPVGRYSRKSSVYFPDSQGYVPYPLQNHLGAIDAGLADRALAEMTRAGGHARTMKEWLLNSFGPTLCELFFFPFHELYTAGLYERIAPQDAYKSPVDLHAVVQGMLGRGSQAGYNITFLYPRDGLDGLARKLAERCDIEYGMRVTQIDTKSRELYFANGTTLPYRRLLSSLPLDRAMQMTGLQSDAEADPGTSVLVLNIGARKGPRCPEDHWLYIPHSRSGFHRVGIYSNVDSSFVPASSQGSGDRVSFYIERALFDRPSEEEIRRYAEEVVSELKEWGYLEETEVVDPTWIDVAYTWSWPNSRWPAEAMRQLHECGVHQIGRYGRWVFQGIAESMREGLFSGAAFR